MQQRSAMAWLFTPDETLVAVLSNESPKACPFWNDLHTENLRGYASYYFECAADHEDSKYVANENLVLVKDYDGIFQLFRIKTVDSIFSGGVRSKKVHAESAIGELNGIIVRPKAFAGAYVKPVMEWVLAPTRWDVGTVDFGGLIDTQWYDYPTALKAMLDVFNQTFLEMRYRVEFNGNRITGRYVDMVTRRGSETGKVFEYSKDMIGISRSGDSSGLATAVIGIGKADATGKFISFVDHVWSTANGDPADKSADQDWIGDDEALAKWGMIQPDGTRQHIFKVYQDGDCDAPGRLLTASYNYLQNIKEPAFQYSIDVALLERFDAQTTEQDDQFIHEKVRIGDTVLIKDITFSPPLVIAVRVLELRRSYTAPDTDKFSHEV